MDYRPERSWKRWFDERVLQSRDEKRSPGKCGFQHGHEKQNDG